MNLLQGKLVSNASQFETYKAQLHRDLLEVVASLKTEALRRYDTSKFISLIYLPYSSDFSNMTPSQLT